MTHLDNPVLFLATANPQTSRRFYEELLGLEFVADDIWHAPSGAFVVWFQDPDGHVLSLTQFP